LSAGALEEWVFEELLLKDPPVELVAFFFDFDFGVLVESALASVLLCEAWVAAFFLPLVAVLPHRAVSLRFGFPMGRAHS